MKESLYQRGLRKVAARSERRRRRLWNEQRINASHAWYGRMAIAQLQRRRKPLRVVALERGWLPDRWWPS